MGRVLPWLLVVVGAAVFANGLRGPLIYDDAESVVGNPQVRVLWPPWAPANTPTAGRPVPAFTLAVNYAIGGLDVTGYHVVNVAIHLANAVVLFALLSRVLRGPRLRDRFGDSAAAVAFACALLWMVHPLVTESVNYVTQRTESIMAFFYLLTLYAAFRAHEGGWRWGVAAVAACALGMASKESMATAPLVVVLCDATLWSRPARTVLRARWRLYAGLAATWLVLIALNIAGPRTATVGFATGVSGVDYLLNQCVVLVDYLRLVAWPNPLVLDYGYPRPLTPADVWPEATGLVLLALATIVALVRRPPVGFALACFFVILAPTSSFVPIASEVGAERRMYLPLAALVALVVIGVRRVVARSGAPWLAPALTIAAAGALAWTTVRRNADYRSELSIWQSAVAALPGNPRAHNNLANVLEEEGRLDDAIAHHRRAVALRGEVMVRPEDRASGHYNLGRVLQVKGDTEAAIAQYELAVGEAPHPRAHHNLGTVLHGLGRTTEAIAHLRRAVVIDPGAADSHSNLGFALLQEGDVAGAIAPLRRALELDPALPRVQFNLAGALRTLGDPEGALPHYRAAARLSTNDAAMQAFVGYSLDDLGRPEEAIAPLRRALAIDPAHAGASERLGGVLVRSGRIEEGVDQLRRTIAQWPARPLAWVEATRVLAEHPDPARRNPAEAVQLGEHVVRMTAAGDAHALAALAAAYAAAGRADDAVAAAERAITAAGSSGDPGLAERVRRQVERYRR